MRNNSKITYFKKGTDKKQKQITVEKYQSAGSCPDAVFLHIQFKCLTKKKKKSPKTQMTFFLRQYLENVMQIS